MRRYEPFDIHAVAARGMNYITSMVDEAYDHLPYWFIQINESPAYARHVRVDDAELVASWYEAIVALEKMNGATERSNAVKGGLKRHLLRSWGPKSLRYHEPYPWSNTQHASFHEMGWVLAGMNQLCRDEPNNSDAYDKSKRLVEGLRSLAIQRTTRTFWSGDFPMGETVYEFPSDIYLPNEGFVDERVTGRGETSIRNAVLLEPLVARAIEFEDTVALDLAVGIANHMLGLSRYFNYKGEFFGHVHSAVWFAIGLVKLGGFIKNERYVEKAVQIFEYVRSLSSEFGWVPEYAQWHPMEEEHCETCCIKDMIVFALEAVELGYDYWDLINKYTRNQLTEQQIKDGCFISTADKADENGYTWKNIDTRAVGGWSGGGEPNSLSLSRFRSIAGCCVGTAPVALGMVYEKTIEEKNGGIYINFPIPRESSAAVIKTGYPNDGSMHVTMRTDGDVLIRHYDWMGEQCSVTVNGTARPVAYRDNCMLIEKASRGDVIVLTHALNERVSHETVRGLSMHITWRGSDVVRMDPPGLPVQMYQRELGVAKSYPKPAGAKAPSQNVPAPTDQKR
ncbi:MAG: hypothetical protein AABZ39_21205 [Spirochaetota bacterium]